MRPLPAPRLPARLAHALGAAPAVALAWLLIGAASPAMAHAVPVSATPAPGSALAMMPTSVTMTFSEAPDGALSTITVLDASGRVVSLGAARAPSGAPNTLHIRLAALGRGIYTVSWRAVSVVDGHYASGSYAFGVGMAPPRLTQAPTTGTAGEIGFVPLEAIAGRWLLYAGLFGLLGAAFVGNVIYPSPPTAMLRVAVVGWVASVVGLSLVTWIQATEAGISFGQLLDTSLGRAAILRLAPLLVAGVALTSQVVGRSISVRALGTAGIGAAGALLADALASHAAAGTHANGHAPHLDVIIQWAHLAGAGVWLGGLVALLTSLRGQDREATARAARRFATSALLGIILVAATGVLRAWSEIGGPGNLLSTDFGRLLIAKSTLVLVLGGLGAVNHFRNVPAVTRSTRPLRRIGALELAVGSTVLLLSASLVNLSPPARNPAATTNPANIAATTLER